MTDVRDNRDDDDDDVKVDSPSSCQNKENTGEDLFRDRKSYEKTLGDRLRDEKTQKNLVQTGAFWSVKIDQAIEAMNSFESYGKTVLVLEYPITTSHIGKAIVANLCEHYEFTHLSVDKLTADIGRSLVRSIVLPISASELTLADGRRVSLADTGSQHYEAIAALLQNVLCPRFVLFSLLQKLTGAANGDDETLVTNRWLVTGLRHEDYDEIAALRERGALLLYVKNVERTQQAYERDAIKRFMFNDPSAPLKKSRRIASEGWTEVPIDALSDVGAVVDAQMSEWTVSRHHRWIWNIFSFIWAWLAMTSNLYVLGFATRYGGTIGQLFSFATVFFWIGAPEFILRRFARAKKSPPSSSSVSSKKKKKQK